MVKLYHDFEDYPNANVIEKYLKDHSNISIEYFSVSPVLVFAQLDRDDFNVSVDVNSIENFRNDAMEFGISDITKGMKLINIMAGPSSEIGTEFETVGLIPLVINSTDIFKSTMVTVDFSIIYQENITMDEVELSPNGEGLSIRYSYRDNPDMISTDVMDIMDLVKDLESKVSFKIPYDEDAGEYVQQFFNNMIESYSEPGQLISTSFLDYTHLFVYNLSNEYKILDILEGDTKIVNMDPRIVTEEAIIPGDRFNRTYDKPVDPVIKLPYIIYPYDYYLWDGSTIIRGGDSSMDAYTILKKSDIHSNQLIPMLLNDTYLQSLLASLPSELMRKLKIPRAKFQNLPMGPD